MRKVLVLALAAGLAGAAALIWLRPARVRPQTSFLLVVIDSLRADHVGAYGYPRATTPRIDALARDGVTFENAYTQAPWTKPSVASIFTSTYISVHRVLYSKQVIDGEDRSDTLNEKFLTLAEAMKSGGFATGGFGQKIHLRPEFGFSQGFDGYDMHARRAENVNRRALAWLAGSAPERFFMYLHYNDPHYPYNPRPEDARFGATSARVQINGETKQAFRSGTLALTREDSAQHQDLYDGEIFYTDRQLGHLIDSIAAMGYTSLVVMVTADHGEEFLDHGDITHGHSLYQELVRVPLIVGGSGLPSTLSARRGNRLDSPAQLIDIMPTLLDMAGLSRPPGLQGHNLLGLIDPDREFAGTGDAVTAGQVVGSGPTQTGGAAGPPVSFSERRDVQETAFWSSVFDGRWKLIDDATRGRTLLFDVLYDPGETLAVQERNEDVVLQLRSLLSALADENRHLYERIQPESTQPLDDETEQRLRSLGYVD